MAILDSDRKRRAAFAKAGLLDGDQLRAEFGVSVDAIEGDIAAFRVFAVSLNGIKLYPTFFFDSEVDRANLAKVIQKLGDVDGWGKWHVLTSRRGSLNGETPLAALARGEVDAVLSAAAAFAER
jgi:hypothetical protein